MNDKFAPLVSIVIPVYNGSNYMREAINSALAQTYENIEVIVVNDGSIDNTEEIALSYGDKIRYFSKENGGVSTALNMGISNMRGEYFAWLSHDDVFYPQKVEKNVEAIKDCPDRIVYSNYDVIDGDGKILSTADFRQYYRYADLDYGLFVVMHGAANGCTIMIPRSNFDEHGLFDESLRTTQDYELFFKMFRGQRLVYINESLTKFRSHEKQQTYINPRTVAEGNALWIGMFEALTKEEILFLGGSERNFWREKAAMLRYTQFGGAVEYAEDKYNACASSLRNARISVVMPFYSRLDLMPKTIESVLNQTYDNFELILINDGTPEDISVIEKIVAKDERIKLIHLPHNKGVSAARNAGIEASVGEFIAFLDSDDLWMPEKLEKHLNYMLDAGIVFSFTSFEQRYLNGDLLKVWDLSKYSNNMFLRGPDGFFLISEICTSSVMFEREALGGVRFPEHINLAEDFCLWFHFIWRYEVGAAPDYLTTMRVQSSSASQDINKQIGACYSFVGYMLEHFKYDECLYFIAAWSSNIYNLLMSLCTNSRGLAPNTSEPVPETSIINIEPQTQESPSEDIVPPNPVKRNLAKRILVKLFKPVYIKVYNRFVGAILNELRQSIAQLSGEMQQTGELISGELQQGNLKLSDELHQCKEQLWHELQQRKEHLSPKLKWQKKPVGGANKLSLEEGIEQVCEKMYKHLK